MWSAVRIAPVAFMSRTAAPAPRQFTKRCALGLLVAASCLTPRLAAGQSPDNVLLVLNEASPASVQVAEYYAQKRRIPKGNVVRLKTPTTEAISRSDYESTIEGPISAWLMHEQLQDRILYIVLTKGIPLRVSGTTGRDATVASVDSELTLLYRRLLGQPAPILGRVENPYFLGEKNVSDAQLFSRFNSDIYLVTRLDGFTVDDVSKL